MYIGTLSYDVSRDRFTGELNTITFQCRLSISPAEKTDAKSPDYRVFIPSEYGATEVGSGWKRKTERDDELIAITLDDPAFPKPLNCILFAAADDDSDYLLAWRRDPAKA